MYTDSFINQVKAVYPSSVLMHELAQDGSYMLGELLQQYAEIEISPERIIEEVNFDNLKAMAKQLLKRRKLYEKWLEVTETERPKKVTKKIK